MKSSWAIQEGESLSNFRSCTRGIGVQWNFRDGSTGRHHLFLLSFHVASLVLVNTISISFYQPKLHHLPCPRFPLRTQEARLMHQHPLPAAVSARSYKHWDLEPAQPTKAICRGHIQVCMGTNLTYQHTRNNCCPPITGGHT